MTTWHSAHVYYYEENKDGLILDGVRPILERQELERQEKGYFVRHWLRGPHLRINILSADGDATLRTVQEEIGRYLRAHPSTAAVDEAAILAAHRQLAAQERERGPLSPLHPDNTIVRAPYDRRLHVLGSEAAAGLLEDFYAETNRSAFDMLEHVRGGANRLVVALDLMLATAHAMWPGITRGFISFRSHAEGFIAQAPDPEARRRDCEEKYRSQAPALRERLSGILDALDHGGDGPPFVADWIATLRRIRERAAPLIAAGELTLDGSHEPDADRRWNPAMLAHSPFHRSLQDNAGLLASLQADPAFLGFRLSLNHLYLHLNRIGIRPFERFVLCHLAARAVEEMFEVSAVDFVRERA
jgi:hypothetical protein